MFCSSHYRVLLPLGMIPRFAPGCSLCGGPGPCQALTVRARTVTEEPEELTLGTVVMDLAGGRDLHKLIGWGVGLTGADADLQAGFPACSGCQTWYLVHPLLRWGLLVGLGLLFFFLFFNYMIGLDGVTTPRLVTLAGIALVGATAVLLVHALTPPPLQLSGADGTVTYAFGNAQVARDFAHRNRAPEPVQVRWSWLPRSPRQASLELTEGYPWNREGNGLVWPLEAAGKFLVLEPYALALSPPPQWRVVLDPPHRSPFFAAMLVSPQQQEIALHAWPAEDRQIHPAFEALLADVGKVQTLRTTVWEQQGGEAMDAVFGNQYRALVALEGLAVWVEAAVEDVGAVQTAQSVARSIHQLESSEHVVGRVTRP